jgi:zinc D-Ala-D-Ala dipeptidase
MDGAIGAGALTWGAGKMAMQKRQRFFFAALVMLAVSDSTAAEPKMPADFVRLRDVTSLALEDMRYAGARNFTGAKVDGYFAPVCWLRRDAAAALAIVAKDLDALGWQLVVYDCYRPTRAVAAFLDWAKLPDNAASKAEFYPRENKNDLFKRGYLAKRSQHSTGTTVDAGAVRKIGGALDFGTPYDFLDVRSATESLDVSAEAQANRRKLRAVLVSAGFSNYRREWWHFSLKSDRKARASNALVTERR